MGAMKNLMMTLQQEFAEYKYIKDGCPEGDAKNESWESMVTSFFDGDEAAALEEFTVWHGGGLKANSELCVPDTPDNHRDHELAEQAREEAEAGLPWDPIAEARAEQLEECTQDGMDTSLLIDDRPRVSTAESLGINEEEDEKNADDMASNQADDDLS